jgi:hypothetical protein
MERIILIISIMDIDRMLLDEQFKKRGAETQWVQMLVKHKTELQQSLDQIKIRISSNGEDPMPMDAKEISIIVVQEAVADDDTGVAGAFDGPSSSVQYPKAEVATSSQAHPSFSPTLEMIESKDCTISLSGGSKGGSILPPAPGIQ